VSSPRSDRDTAYNTAATNRSDGAECEVVNDEQFRQSLALERKRSERSKTPFLLMLAELSDPAAGIATLDAIAAVLRKDIRETDVIGWYQEGTTLAVLFTGVTGDRSTALGTISGRVRSSLECKITPDELQQVRLSFHFFPDDWNFEGLSYPGNPALYLDVMLAAKRKRVLFAIKRVIDIIFSTAVLVICAPLFLWIALAIKVTSKGPVFFRQKRIGQYGKPFVFLKFRSMFKNSDVLVHKNFITGLISDLTSEKPLRDEQNAHYKIKDDNRVTRIGRFIRRTSLDELPQLINVLKGEMSLVGPRPAIPYEVEIYQTWHRQRVLAAKPGITGIWQVEGRSRVKFDEMVRMDLRYAMAWSPWLDLKILLLTPFAVIRGSGAF
jgi:lipopolysaccharide/colanic/teichoic acid biosynthesis glycosyltransferase